MPVAARSLANLRKGGGRAGMPQKIPQSIKEMVENALHKAGGVDYLARQAEANPVAFMGLVGRVLPLQLAGADGGKLVVDFRWADAPPDPPTIDAVVDAPTQLADETTDAPTIAFEGEA